MKTVFYGLLILIATIIVTAVAVWGLLRLAGYLDRKVFKGKELRDRWKNSQQIEIRLWCDVFRDVFDVQVRKRRWRMFPNQGWKYVNQYVKGDPILDQNNESDPDLNWKRVSYRVGLDQFKEQELLRACIKTYGDLDAYFYLRADQYFKDRKSALD